MQWRLHKGARLVGPPQAQARTFRRRIGALTPDDDLQSGRDVPGSLPAIRFPYRGVILARRWPVGSHMIRPLRALSDQRGEDFHKLPVVIPAFTGTTLQSIDAAETDLHLAAADLIDCLAE